MVSVMQSVRNNYLLVINECAARLVGNEGTDDELVAEITDGELVEINVLREMKRELFVT
ncbi:hypothetical protein A2U01_0010787 [Trifolium medium]|uniref:Uncharacterized protein n=1 Tax=Trifolium medium TaxID=97028 RepID=A0A392MRE9_9FABA|nr:hypothetical protein [Trifolium medium]